MQSKLYLTDISQWEDAGRAHGEVFGEIRPTLSLVHVLPFLDPKMLVEIELVAQKSVTSHPSTRRRSVGRASPVDGREP